MGETVEKVTVKGDASDLKQEMNGAGESMTSSLLKANLAAAALTKALNVTVGVIKDAAGAAAENERTTLRLQAALRGSGHEVENNTAALNDQSTALERLSGISDEEIRRGQALALNMGVRADEVDKYTRAAIRMSNTVGGDLQSNLQQLTRTLTGQAGRLSQMLPGVRELTEEQLRAGDAVDLVNEMWSENLDLLNQGFTGKINALANAFGNVTEAAVIEIGGGQSTLADIIEATTTALETLANSISRFGIIESLATIADIVFTGGENIRDEGLLAAARGAPQPGAPQPTGAPDAGRAGPGGRPDRKKKRKPKKDKEKLPQGFLGEGAMAVGNIFFVEEESMEAEAQRFIDTIIGAHDDALAANDDFIAAQKEQKKEWIEINKDADAAVLKSLDEGQKARTAIAEDAAEKRIRIAEKEAREQIRVSQQMAGIIGGAVGGLASTVLEGFVQMAEGQEVAIDKMIKDFLRGQGMQLISQGITSAATGALRLLLSYGADASGWGLIAQGGAMIGLGIPMLAGSLAIQTTPQGAGATGGGASAGGADATGGGPALGGSDIQSFDEYERQNTATPTSIFVFGELTDQQTIRLRREFDNASVRGV